MIAAKRLLVDTNVWLDYYLQEGAFGEAMRLVELAEAGRSTFCTRQRRQRTCSISCLGVSLGGT